MEVLTRGEMVSILKPFCAPRNCLLPVHLWSDTYPFSRSIQPFLVQTLQLTPCTVKPLACISLPPSSGLEMALL